MKKMCVFNRSIKYSTAGAVIEWLQRYQTLFAINWIRFLRHAGDTLFPLGICVNLYTLRNSLVKWKNALCFALLYASLYLFYRGTINRLLQVNN